MIGEIMFQGVDHVVIRVKDLESAISKYENIYGTKVTERGETPEAGMQQAYFRFGETFVELVSNVGDEGIIAKSLESRGEGVHLIAMRVDDIDAAVTDLRTKGVRLVGDPGEGNPVTGQVFIHPAETGGVLTQIIAK
tara:strand:+ start:17919 stop:18329 length:411 start_codon:yes stop_codon:yes gene_type:complete